MTFPGVYPLPLPLPHPEASVLEVLCKGDEHCDDSVKELFAPSMHIFIDEFAAEADVEHRGRLG